MPTYSYPTTYLPIKTLQLQNDPFGLLTNILHRSMAEYLGKYSSLITNIFKTVTG